ncbi:hypothetical protein RB595_007122 [Gaeumannomyces hyphopodioides]
MALSLATLQEAVGYVRLALRVYNDIQAVPGEIAELKTELEALGAPLSALTNLLKDPKETEPLGRLDSNNRKTLVDSVQDASAACKEVHSIFKNVKSRHLGFLGGHDLRARAEWVARAWHRFGFGADQVNSLMHRIKTRCQSIQFTLSIINIIPKKRLQADIVAQQKEKAALEKSRKEIQFLKNDAARRDAQLQAMDAKLGALVDALVKTKAEAKKAKERECLDTATAATGQADAKPAKKTEKEPPGPGHLSKTPSIGPKVIRGAPKSQTSEQKGKSNKGKAEMANVGTKPPVVKQAQPPIPPKAATPPKATTSKATTSPKAISTPPKSTTTPPKATTIPLKTITTPPKAATAPPKATTTPPKAATPAKTSKASPSPPVVKQPRPPTPPKATTRARTPKPSPSPSRGGRSVLFVDTANLERSILCHAMLSLLHYSTREKGGRSPIAAVHSAGYFVENQSDCIDEIRNRPNAVSGSNLPVVASNRTPRQEAFDLLFQPGSDGSDTAPWWKGCDPANKARQEEKFRGWRSVGMRREFFSEFDYIVCFTKREYENLMWLRGTAMAKSGAGAWPEGKGRILHLGIYLSEDGAPARAILQPTNDRSAWKATISKLKTALQGFLVKELQWDQSQLKRSGG